MIDPVAGSASTLLAASQIDRKAFGFEIKKKFFNEANQKILKNIQRQFI